MPGDPAAQVVSPEFDQSQAEDLISQYGLNEPLHVQYWLYLKNIALHGDLGVSFQHNTPVTPFILSRALNTIAITVPAVVLAFVIGPLMGSYFSWHRNQMADNIGSSVVIVTYAAPIFWTGMLALMLFSFQLGWLPSGGMREIGYVPTSLADRFLSIDFLKHALLPFTVFFLWRVSRPALIMRNNMLDVLGSDFIELKRAEGLPERTILYRHGARNALLPVLHYSALALGFAFGGSVILETVFSWPGVGLAMWNAVFASDYPVAQAAFILVSFLIIIFNFIVDILSSFVDPRVAQGEVET